MSNIIPFEFESNKIRTVVDKDNTILFVAKDIATALGYKNISDAIKDNCNGVARSYPIVDSLGRTQKARVITEPDIYRLIVESKLPSAEKFERWIFEEVLPILRKEIAAIEEIAKTTGKDHARVLRDLENILKDTGIPALLCKAGYIDKNNQTHKDKEIPALKFKASYLYKNNQTH